MCQNIKDNFFERIKGWKNFEDIKECIEYISEKNSSINNLLEFILAEQDKGKLLIQESLDNLFQQNFPKELKSWIDYKTIQNKYKK